MTAISGGPGPSAVAKERPDGLERAAVLDIGSNSVRMVVYEINGAAISELYNEKSACMLGRGEAQSGNIAPENARLALDAIERFVAALKRFDAETLHVIATSAVRDAANGAGFMALVKEITGVEGQILSGAEEAHFAALGVVSSVPDFCGVVGDLGGGSLELARVDAGLDAGGCSLQLGVIRLQDESAMSAKRALEIAGERLRDSKILTDTDSKQKKGGGRVFCAIGGTWRALAKLIRLRGGYPAQPVHHFRVDAAQVLALARELVEKGQETPGLDRIGRARAALLPYGAAVLVKVLEGGGFTSVLFGAAGVRQGYLFARLKPVPTWTY